MAWFITAAAALVLTFLFLAQYVRTETVDVTQLEQIVRAAHGLSHARPSGIEGPAAPIASRQTTSRSKARIASLAF
jgi:hypothetical protein